MDWLKHQVNLFRDLAREEGFITDTSRTVLAEPGRSLQGSTADRKLNIGFVESPDTDDDIKYQKPLDSSSEETKRGLPTLHGCCERATLKWKNST